MGVSFKWNNVVEMTKASLVDVLKAFSILKIVKVFIKIVVIRRIFVYLQQNLNNSSHQPTTLKTSRLGSESSNARRTRSGD
jgi:hypothetical protein